MIQFIPLIKDTQRYADHSIRDVMDMFNKALKEDGVTKPDLSLADMLAGPNIGGLTLTVAGASYKASYADMQRLRDYDLTPMLSSSGVQEIWQHLRWSRGGRVIYDLNENLANAFFQTDVTLYGDDLRFPVPSFYLAIPESLGLTLWHEESGEHPLDGFYVNEVTHDVLPPEEQDDPRGVLCVLPSGQRYTVPRGSERSIAFFAQGRHRPGHNVGDAPHVHFSIPLASTTKDLETWLASKTIDSEREDIGVNEERLWTWARIVVNTCLYLTSEKPDIEKRRLVSDEARARAKKLGGKAGQRYLDDATTKDVNYSVIGGRMVFDKSVTGAGIGAQHTVGVRFIVRGHWRNQPYGEGMLLRKRLWIQPHWKGPEWAEIVARVQHVEGEKDAAP